MPIFIVNRVLKWADKEVWHKSEEENELEIFLISNKQ